MSALFDERVVAVQPSLVRAVGSVTRAAVLQQIHYHDRAGHVREHDRHRWVVRTYAELGDEIGLTGEQVRRAVEWLRAPEHGFIETCNASGYDRQTWYRVHEDHPALSDSSKRRNRQFQTAESPVPNGGSASSSSTEGGKGETPPAKEPWQEEKDAEREERRRKLLAEENRRLAEEATFEHNEQLRAEAEAELEREGGAAPPPGNLRDALTGVPR